MYDNVLGIVQIRQKENPNLFDVFCDIAEITDDIVVLDPNNLLTKPEKYMLMDKFLCLCLDFEVKEVDYESYNPDWIFACYNDERPSTKFRYMKISLFANPFIQAWTSNLKYLWNDIEYYRADIPWNNYETILLYKYIAEMDYKKYNGLIPTNIIGPIENCMLDLYSYRYINHDRRKTEYEQYQKNILNYNLIERQHYESLCDTEINVERALD